MAEVVKVAVPKVVSVPEGAPILAVIKSFMCHFLKAFKDAFIVGEHLKNYGFITLTSTVRSVKEDAPLMNFLFMQLGQSLNNTKSGNVYSTGYKFTDYEMFSNCRGDTNLNNFIRNLNLKQSQVESLKRKRDKLFRDLTKAQCLLVDGFNLIDSPDSREPKVILVLCLCQMK
jgi:hypothetical protein